MEGWFTSYCGVREDWETPSNHGSECQFNGLGESIVGFYCSHVLKPFLLLSFDCGVLYTTVLCCRQDLNISHSHSCLKTSCLGCDSRLLRMCKILMVWQDRFGVSGPLFCPICWTSTCGLEQKNAEMHEKPLKGPNNCPLQRFLAIYKWVSVIESDFDSEGANGSLSNGLQDEEHCADVTADVLM